VRCRSHLGKEAMKVLKWFAGFVRFMNRNTLIAREVDACNQNMKNNERFAPRERKAASR
jgi:hypothetical protein